MKRPRQVLWLGVAALGLGGALIPPAGHADEMPCTAEIRTYCADVQPGGGRILQCLKANESKLSMACVQRVQSLQETVSGSLGACRDDWVAYCYHPRASTERGAMVECLQTHLAQVSSACQKALQGAGTMQRQRSRGMMP
jgi:hypothetical protein